MKTLQNNFTTPEQSKRLLELGVPVDSADCYYLRESPNRLCILNDGVTISNLRLQLYMSHTMPCWSVGRLIEIFEVCTGIVWENEIIEGYTKIDMLIEDFDARHVSMDFSKLKE